MVETSVIILSYNGEKYLKNCIDSLRKQTYKNFEIIIVDNLSKDNSVKIIEENYPEVNLIKSKVNLGYAGGNNEGVKRAKGKYIVLLNQDIVADKNYLKELVKIMKSDEKIGACQPKVLLMNQKDKVNTTELMTNYLGFSWCGNYLSSSDEFSKIQEICFPSGVASIYRKDVYEKVGGLDEDYFTYHEDTDIGWKIRLIGYKIFLNPNSIIYHDYSYSRNPKKTYHEEKNRISTLLKNYSKKSLILILPMLIVTEIGMIFYSFIDGFLREKIEGYAYIIRNRKKILLKRKFIQEKRKVPDREIVKFFVDKITFKKISNVVLIHVLNPLLSMYWKVIKNLI